MRCVTSSADSARSRPDRRRAYKIMRWRLMVTASVWFNRISHCPLNPWGRLLIVWINCIKLPTPFAWSSAIARSQSENKKVPGKLIFRCLWSSSQERCRDKPRQSNAGLALHSGWEPRTAESEISPKIGARRSVTQWGRHLELLSSCSQYARCRCQWLRWHRSEQYWLKVSGVRCRSLYSEMKYRPWPDYTANSTRLDNIAGLVNKNTHTRTSYCSGLKAGTRGCATSRSIGTQCSREHLATGSWS